MTPEEFANIWNSSSSAIEAAACLGKTSQAVSVRAHRLRKKRPDLKIKKMPFHRIKSVIDRFLAKIEKTDDCWFWTGSCNRKGYGQLSTRRGQRPLLVHRFSYEHFIGPIPQDMHVLHQCDNPSCVNPDHLFLGTCADNTHDMMSKDRGWWQSNAPRHNW